MIIDVHGHYTTVPPAVALWRARQVAAYEAGERLPRAEELDVTDDELRSSVASKQLQTMDERGCDVTLFSPRASKMEHHIGDLAVSTEWARVSNELVYRIAQLFPRRFYSVAMLPQSPGEDPSSSVAELERYVQDYGIVGVNLNPDPSGGRWSAPPLSHRSWYPLYEKLVEHELPAMLHVSASSNAALHTTGDWYLGADTTVFMQLLKSDVFTDFPALKFVIPHGGGSAAFHWGRFRGMVQDQGWKPLEVTLRNVYFDTCVYHQPGIDLMAKVMPVANVLFGSETVGAVRGVDPLTGFHYDDTKRYIAAAQWNPEEQAMVLEHNARRVYPRLDRAIQGSLEVPSASDRLVTVPNG